MFSKPLNKLMTNNSIKIKKNYLLFREHAKNIFNALPRNVQPRTVNLDFSELNFMSRSFVDELLTTITRSRNKKFFIKIVNLKPSLKKFFNQVKKTKEKIQKEVSGSRCW